MTQGDLSKISVPVQTSKAIKPSGDHDIDDEDWELSPEEIERQEKYQEKRAKSLLRLQKKIKPGDLDLKIK